MRKTGSNNHQREQKASKKITSIRRPHSWIKDDVKIRQMTCHNPFKKKNTQRKEEKPLRIHYRHFKWTINILTISKIIQSIHKQVRKYQLNVLQEKLMKNANPFTETSTHGVLRKKGKCTSRKEDHFK